MKVIDLFETFDKDKFNQAANQHNKQYEDVANWFLDASDSDQIDWIHKTNFNDWQNFGNTIILHMIQHSDKELSPDVQIALVNKTPTAIRHLVGQNKYPCIQAQKIAINKNPFVIASLFDNGHKPSFEIILLAVNNRPDVVFSIPDFNSIVGVGILHRVLTDKSTLQLNKQIYDDIVKYFFPTSSLLVNKWIRFGDRARSQIAKGKWK